MSQYMNSIYNRPPNKPVVSPVFPTEPNIRIPMLPEQCFIDLSPLSGQRRVQAKEKAREMKGCSLSRRYQGFMVANKDLPTLAGVDIGDIPESVCGEQSVL